MVHNADTLEVQLTRARQRLQLAGNDLKAAERAMKSYPDTDPKLLAAATARFEQVKAEFDALNNQSIAAERAMREAERQARLAEAEALEARARELRSLWP